MPRAIVVFGFNEQFGVVGIVDEDSFNQNGRASGVLQNIKIRFLDAATAVNFGALSSTRCSEWKRTGQNAGYRRHCKFRASRRTGKA